jgi:ubiquinone/menaquinone biosynthesis C-methylase UbiE
VHSETEHERRYHGGPDRLRAPQRIALLEVERVVGLCTEGPGVASVLDVGTGTGIFAEAFVAGTRRVTGIDPGADLLARARALVPGVEFLIGIAEKLPFRDEEFDLVFLGHVLHETDNPAVALAEARRVARRRVSVLEWPCVDEEQGPPRAHRLEPSAILALAKEAGFTSIERLTLSHMELYRFSP